MKNYILGALVLLANLQVTTARPPSITVPCRELTEPSLKNTILYLLCETGWTDSCDYTKPIPPHITKLYLYGVSGNMFIKSTIPSTVTQITVVTTDYSTVYLPRQLPPHTKVVSWNASTLGDDEDGDWQLNLQTN